MSETEHFHYTNEEVAFNFDLEIYRLRSEIEVYNLELDLNPDNEAPFFAREKAMEKVKNLESRLKAFEALSEIPTDYFVDADNGIDTDSIDS